MSRRRELLLRLEREEWRAQHAALLVGGMALAWAFQQWALLGLTVVGVLVVALAGRRQAQGGALSDLLLAGVGGGLGALLGLGAGEPAPGLAAFLLSAQVGKLAFPRQARDRGLSQVVGIVLLAVAAAEGVEPAFGFLLLIATALTVQVAVRRNRTRLAREVLVAGGGARAVAAPPARVSTRALLGSGRNALLLLCGMGLVFFSFPRFGPKLLPARRQAPERLSGFTDEVGLDDIGRIKQSDQLAFRVELPPGVELEQEDGPYWRGTALDSYDGSTWRRSEALRLPWNFEVIAAGTFHDQRLQRPPGEPVEAVVYLEPFGSRFLFGPGAVDQITFKTAGPRYINRDAHGGMAISQPALVPLAYRVRCWPDAIAEPRLPRTGRELRERLCLELPARLDRDALRRYADEALRRAGVREGAPPSRVARALEAYLSRACTYSVEGASTGGNEPVEEFLLRRRTGHCELFASALAVLLRLKGVPSRLVTGFRGGDLSEWSGTWTVRQREAHAWVEAWTETGWMRLDATPAAQPGARLPFAEAVQELTDWLELRWFQYVIAYDAYDQRNFLFWLQTRLGDQLDGLGLPRGAIVPVALAASALGLLLVVWVLRRVRRARRAGAGAARSAPPALARLLAALRRHGLTPAPAETLLELSRRASRALGVPAAALPDLVPSYYAARFGERPLDDTASRLESLARALEALPDGNLPVGENPHSAG